MQLITKSRTKTLQPHLLLSETLTRCRLSFLSFQRWSALFFIALAAVLFTGCAGPIADPSHLMQKAPAAVGTPPSDKSLVLIHRPRNYQGYGLYTGVWDSRHFIADLGNGHSAAYECEPGTHYFINRSVERVGVVEAQLLPAQTYDLRLDTAGAFI